MATSPTTVTAQDRELLSRAGNGDEDAFARLVEPHRRELHAHCYRMLGSLHDAEDALQNAMLRAWKGLGRLNDPSALRAWLYRISTNACLDLIEKRPKRVLPVDYGPPIDPHDGPAMPLVESVWIEPYPDELLGVEDGYASPEARYEQRESVELAFIAALQLLPASQRGVLVMREVLGFSAKETAEALETTTASVNSALQRARKTIEDRLPEQSQQQTLRELGDDGVKEVVGNYVDAWESGDIDQVISMLTEDAAFAMPPAPSWHRGTEMLRRFLEVGPLSGAWRWKPQFVWANGQPALGYYAWDEGERAYLPFALNVLTLRGDKVSEVEAFIVRSTDATDLDSYKRWPEEPIVHERFVNVFQRFGLPERLT